MGTKRALTPPIAVLPEAVAARIAAGEVVERPASVVKELVENSLDAGASRIEIDVVDGGRSGITVIDNGHGIPAGQIELAFERFATSKIDQTSELAEIATLGFRGEALPSIASVSIVEIVSRSADDEAGRRLVLEFGEIRTHESTGVPPGTTVRVRDLFGNVPARRRFLSSAGAELTRLSTVASSYALARPDVAIRLAAGGSIRFATSGNGDSRDAAAAVYGPAVAGAMLDLPTASEDGGQPIRAAGLASSPGLNRGNRNYVTISVNGRWILSRRLSFAVEQAYRGYLPDRRFPLAVINITAPGGDLDVNVHPSKAEVKFLREQAVFGAVQKAVRSALVEHAPVAEARRFSAPSPGAATAGPNPMWPDPLTGSPLGGAAPATGDAGDTNTAGIDAPYPGTSAGIEAPITPQRALPVLRLLGQAHETYLIAEGPDGVYLIDQHAAHERVVFEQISDRLAAGPAESQQLLSPEIVDLQPHQEEALARHGEELSKLGFLIEPFGPHTVALRAIPAVLKDNPAAESLGAILDAASEGGDVAEWRQKLLATLACHASVTAGRRMAADEARELLRQLEASRQPHTCPHGRPTMIHMSGGALDREFGRR